MHSKQKTFHNVNHRLMIPLWKLRDAICGKRCDNTKHFMSALFTPRGRMYMDMYIATYARAYIEACARGKTRSKTKRATKDTPAVFGTYLRPALDKAHFVHLKMHSLDNTAWARYFVTYFRQYLLTEVGSRYNQCQLWISYHAKHLNSCKIMMILTLWHLHYCRT